MPNAAAGVLTGTAGLTCSQAAAWDRSGETLTSSTDLQQCPAGLEEARSYALTGFTASFKFYLSRFYATPSGSVSLPDNDCIA